MIGYDLANSRAGKGADYSRQSESIHSAGKKYGERGESRAKRKIIQFMWGGATMPVRGSKRYTVMGGWIVDHKAKKLVKPSPRSLRGLASLTRKHILTQPLNDWHDFFEATTESVIVPTSDGKLFEALSSALYEFCEMRDGSVHLMVPTNVQKYQQQIKHTFKARCHKINLGGRKTKYLRLVGSPDNQSESDTSLRMNNGYLAFHLEKDNSVFSKDIGVQQFTFTEEDYSVLNSYMSCSTDYKFFGQKYLNHAYIKAQKNGCDYLNVDMKDGIAAMVKKFSPDTVDEYGYRLGPLFFLLLHARKLSNFRDLTFISEDKIDILGKDMDDLLKVPGKMRIVGDMLQKCITSDAHRDYMVRWIRLCSFSFNNWNDFHQPCPVHRSGQMRRQLDVVRCFVVFTCFATVKSNDEISKMGQTFSSGSALPLNNFWSWLRRIYSKVIKEEGNDTLTFVNVEHREKSVIVNGKQLNFKYIRDMKTDLMNSFIDLVADLHEYCTFGDVFEVYSRVMANHTVPIVDSFEKEGSVFDVIHEKAVSEFRMRMRMREHANEDKCENTYEVPAVVNEEDPKILRLRKKVLKIIEEITKIVMVSVWINPGLALRFPELSILSFAGGSRNIYFDTDDRVFIVLSRYNKNTRYETRLLFLDRIVSAQLFWFIYILRPFAIQLLESKISAMNTKEIIGMWKQPVESDDEPSIQEESEEIEFNFRLHLHSRELKIQLELLSPRDRGIAVMKTMLFVDVQNMSLIGYSAFTNTLVQYPRGVSLRESHKIRTLRQGLAAIWKHFIIRDYVDNVASMETGIANGFGHGLSSSRTSYGVDNGKTAGNAAIGYYMAKKLCVIFQQRTHPILREKDPRYFTSDTGECASASTESEMDSVGDTWDLAEVGGVLMSELASRNRQSQEFKFKFKSTDQLIFTSTVLQSDRLLVALQAPTAFGKTLTYVLPMLVLKRTRPGRYIHFVAVPYVSLKVATVNRLRSYGLDAVDSRFVHNAELMDGTTFSSVDVIVGTFESFGAQWMYSLLNEWKLQFRQLPTKEKGYFIVDEAHVLWLERKFRPQLNRIVSLKWSEFLRVVMLSAAFPRWLFEKVCEQMNFSSHSMRNARWSNAVQEIPNAAVLKDITRTDARAAKNVVYDRINSYLRNTIEGKAVFFFGSKRLLREYYEIWKDDEAVAAVDADMTETRKLEIFREFECAKSKTRIVMGTKLVSNGLDCPSVNYVCLVRCSVNVIDFLQMVGRIRRSGYLEVVDVGRNATAAANGWEIVEHRDLLPMSWSVPIEATVAKFYGLQNAARPGLGAVTGDRYYQNIDESVIQLKQQVRQRVSTGEAARLIESTGDPISVPGMLKLAMRSLQEESGLYRSELRDLLKKESKIYLPSFRDLLNGVAPNALLRLDSCTFPGVCSNCYVRNELCQCHTFGKSMGKIINEVSVLCKLRKKEPRSSPALSVMVKDS